MRSPLFVLNGPNLNLLGTREPDIYGTLSLQDIEKMCCAHAKKHGLSCVFRQTNHEGVLIDWIHEAQKTSLGVILNAGAYTHTSLAIYDALKNLTIPVVEVHLSPVYKREEFRHRSVIAPACDGVISGFGVFSYLLGIDAICYTTPSTHS